MGSGARWQAVGLAFRAFVRADAAAAVRLPLNALADYHMSVNYRPTRRKCLPVIAPAQAFVRAGKRRGKMRNSEFGMRNRGRGMSVSGDCGSVGAVDLV